MKTLECECVNFKEKVIEATGEGEVLKLNKTMRG